MENDWRLIDIAVPGGRVAAKRQHNIHVIQVFDKGRLLARFIGGENLGWPSFLLDVGDASEYADDTTHQIVGVAFVSGTHRYESVSGAARTVFVVKLLRTNDLPPYAGR